MKEPSSVLGRGKVGFVWEGCPNGFLTKALRLWRKRWCGHVRMVVRKIILEKRQINFVGSKILCTFALAIPKLAWQKI